MLPVLGGPAMTILKPLTPENILVERGYLPNAQSY
jgi:hypothetical protein